MARISLPENDQGESELIRALRRRPAAMAVMTAGAGLLEASTLSLRETEAARYRVAIVNTCVPCQGNVRAASEAGSGVSMDLYENVTAWRQRSDVYSAREQHAIELAERFALDPGGIDDAFLHRFLEHFTEDELLDLCVYVGSCIMFGRTRAVLQLDYACTL